VTREMLCRGLSGYGLGGGLGSRTIFVAATVATARSKPCTHPPLVLQGPARQQQFLDHRGVMARGLWWCCALGFIPLSVPSDGNCSNGCDSNCSNAVVGVGVGVWPGWQNTTLRLATCTHALLCCTALPSDSSVLITGSVRGIVLVLKLDSMVGAHIMTAAVR
jgi:hypothetical protein